jgi:hypothetical protein
MSEFIILETENGLTVATKEAGESAEDSALRHNGVVVDAGPFKTYDDAQDALLLLIEPEDDSDVDEEPPA